MKSIREFFLKHGFLLIVCFYLLMRTVNLTLLPIFGDEAIYLEWAWRMTHQSGFLYYSLFDGKQPFLMWIFGIAESFIHDPLLAGRLVSVITGFLTLLGIYKIAKFIFSDIRFAYLSAILYIIVPIFSFFDRQALMESAIAASGIWACYWYLRFYRSKKFTYSVLIGCALGIGFFIKSSIMIYLATIFLLHIFNIKEKKYRNTTFISVCLIIFVFILINLLLIIHPQFWSSLSMTSRYSLTVSEVLRFPFSTWFTNMIIDAKVLFASFTPLMLILTVVGLVLLFKRNKKIILLLILLPLVLQILFTRGATDRYLVSYLPLLIIPAVLSIKMIMQKYKMLGTAVVVIAIIAPLCLTIFQLASPAKFILFSSKYLGYADTGYIDGMTSGYGVPDAVSYLEKNAQNKKMFVAVAGNVGNPESAVMAYFRNHSVIKPIYFDLNQNPIPVDAYDCISFEGSETSYFISREDQLAGLNRFLKEEKRIHNPYNLNTIGIYSFKKDCGEKTLTLYPTL